MNDTQNIGSTAPNLSIVKPPAKVSYRPGEKISYDGLAVTLDGRDVTSECEFSVSPGTPWDAGDRELSVTVSHPGAVPATVTLRRKRALLIPLLAALLVIAVAGGVCAAVWFSNQPVQGDTGSYVMPQGDMTREEAVAMLDEMAEKSRITVSVAPYMVLRDTGELRVNFEVIAPNNGLSERIEITQDSETVYRSGIVDPGNSIVWGESSNARLGPATATVYAVSDGADTGNPISVEVEIVEPGFKAPDAQ